MRFITQYKINKIRIFVGADWLLEDEEIGGYNIVVCTMCWLG